MTVEKKADYVLALMGNQVSLRENVEPFVAEQKAADFRDTTISRDQTVDREQGRIATRTTAVIHDMDWQCKRHRWPGLNGVIVVESKRNIGDKRECEPATTSPP